MTIAQQIKWDFTNCDLAIQDKNNKLIYLEFTSGYWAKYEYDSQGKKIYYENSNGFWGKWKYDSQGKKIYFEHSNGEIIDNRPKLCESKEIVIEGVKYRLTKL